MCIDNIGACDARNLEESCGQGGRGDLRMVKVSPSWPWLVAWTSPSTCTRALSHRENMRLWMGMKAQNAAWPVDGIPDEIFMGRYMAKWGSGEASFPIPISFGLELSAWRGFVPSRETVWCAPGPQQTRARRCYLHAAGDDNLVDMAGDNPKAGKTGLERVENMRRDGPVPA